MAIIFLISAATLAVFTLTPAKNLVNLGGGDGQKTTQRQSYVETIEPYSVDGKPASIQLPDGSEGLIFKRTKRTDNLDEVVQPKLSLWQKLKQVGWWWLALTIGGMFFGPLGMVMSTINSKAKAAALAVAGQVKSKYEDMTTESKRIVLSVDKGLDVFDASIAAANAAVSAAEAAAALTADPQVLSAQHTIKATYQAVSKALVDTKKAFLIVLKNEQDESTKLLISKLRSGTPIV